MASQVELLAPAGSFEALIAAVQNGANAVYLGGQQYSARASATNFSNTEIKEAVQYAHLRNVKIYVTVNTLYSDIDFSSLYTYLSFLYTNQVDAIIVQDPGLLYVAKTYFPKLEVHVSTQASVYQPESVAWLEKQGVIRVVLARENTLKEIQTIGKQNPNMELEVFVHGAQCISFSGQCLLSSFIGKRSGNKGSCAQPCRLGYTLLKNRHPYTNKKSYLLSPQDLCTIEDIPKIINAGVTSLKIEGRMKHPAYIATVVSSYRKAIDAYYNNEEIAVDPLVNDMKQMFNRGFTQGHILQYKQSLATNYPGHRGIPIGKVIRCDSRNATIVLEKPLQLQDRIVFDNQEGSHTVTKILQSGKGNAQGTKIQLPVTKKIPLGATVYKVYDTALVTKATRGYQKEHITVPISMNFTGKVGETCSLQITDGVHHIKVSSDTLVTKAEDRPLSAERIEQQLKKLGNTVYTCTSISITFDSMAIIAIQTINALRRQATKQLDELRCKNTNVTMIPDWKPITYTASHTIKGIAIRVRTLIQLEMACQFPASHIFYPIDDSLAEAKNIATRYQKEIIPYHSFLQPLTAFQKEYVSSQFTSIMVSTYGDLLQWKDKQCILDTSFNITNSYASAFFNNYDFVCSLETGRKQVNRWQTDKQIFYTVYGYVQSMISKYCPIQQQSNQKECGSCHQNTYALQDRKQEIFPIQMDTSCHMHLYNSRPLYIDDFQQLHADYIIISFTIETKDSCQRVLEDYFYHIWENKKSQYKSQISYTKGYINT